MRTLMLLALLLGNPALYAQAPSEDWRTIETPHFRVHYPAEYETWSMRAASRLESIREAVSNEVGFTPPQTVDVVVMNPIAQPNGSAWPLLDTPRMIFFAEPPGPDEQLGAYGHWIDLLAVHEFTHTAHMLRPSRNGFERAIEKSVLPLDPIVLRAPRWVLEGYATVIEGRLTGAGRPTSTIRALLLRRWAESGRLPSYGELNSSRRFAGMSMAYLMGSAFLEWLEQRAGPNSLRNLWARLTARHRRSFDEAFTGVFGESAERLYGRFLAEVTASAIAIDRARTLREGELFQETPRNSGDPAVSPDGSQIAVVIRAREQPERLVIWSTAAPVEEEKKFSERLAKILEKDPEDVAPLRTKPLPRKDVYALTMPDGGDIATPRWTRDGKAIVFAHRTPDTDGFLHFDLYRWDFEHLTRITRLADVRDADPLPDGRTAIAVRSRYGATQLVNVDLTNGAITPRTEPSIDVVYTHPRVSSDGAHVAYVAHREGRWTLYVDDEARPLPGDVSSPEWLANGDIIATIASGGFAELASVILSRPGRLRRLAKPSARFVNLAGLLEENDICDVIKSRELRGAQMIGPNDVPSPGAEPALSVVEGRHPLPAPQGEGHSEVMSREPFSPRERGEGARRADEGRVIRSRDDGEGSSSAQHGRSFASLTMTASRGGAFDAAPSPDGRVFFMSLEPDGYVVRVLNELAPVPASAALDAALVPAIPPPPTQPAAFTATPVTSHRYGIGRQEFSWFTSTNFAVDQRAFEAGVRFGDVVGRLDSLFIASVAHGDVPQGVALASAWRGWPVELGAHAFRVEDRQSCLSIVDRQDCLSSTGLELRARWSRQWPLHRLTLEAGALSNEFAFGSAAFSTEQVRGTWHFDEGVRAEVDDAHQRAVLDASIRTGSFRLAARVQHDRGDNLVLGGIASSILPRSAYARRVLDPALPVATLAGSGYDGWRIETKVPLMPFTAFYQRHDLGGVSLSLYGVEAELHSDPLPILKVPGLDLTAGVARADDRTNWWLSMRWRP